MNVFLFAHLERGKNEGQNEIENERRRQHRAAVERHLEGHEKTSRRTEVDQINLDLLRGVSQLPGRD